MKENVTKGIVWNQAGVAGVVIGLVSSVYIVLTQFLSDSAPAMVATVANFILWAAKFGGCIWLMRYFMKKLVLDYAGVDNATVFRFGLVTAACSALITAAVSLANVLIINPDLIAEQMQLARQIYGSALDSNTMSALDSIEGSMPQIIFFSNLVYCFLYGLILSLILSRNIPPQNPFAGMNYNNEEI